MKNGLIFELLSGGRLEIDLSRCSECSSKVCIEVCNLPGMGQVLKLEEGKPTLSRDVKEVSAGACTECLNCELTCKIHGKGAIHIHLPMPELEAFLKDLKTKGLHPVYSKD